jgi:hypothetical protein
MEPKMEKRLRNVLIAGVVIGIIVTCLLISEYGLAPFRFLPSDEEMIDHFRKHRADFELLVQIYREDPHLPNRGGIVWEPTPEIEAIMKRINVRLLRTDRCFWLPPDPYSEDAKTQTETLQLGQKRGEAEARQYSGVLLGYAHPPVRRGLVENFSQVFKGYYYTPFPPRIEEGRLKRPFGFGDEWIFPTLDLYPSKFTSEWCVYRQFEPQWFIEMCQGH